MRPNHFPGQNHSSSRSNQQHSNPPRTPLPPRSSTAACSYSCQWRGITFQFEIPKTVRRSTSADVVNNVSSLSPEKIRHFIKLRVESREIFKSWMEKDEHLSNTLKMPNPFPHAISVAERDLEAARAACKDKLLEMAHNGIWNCAEFAYFALITISEKLILPSGYTARIATLNNPQVPAAEYKECFRLIMNDNMPKELLQDLNHDHVFVAIVDNQDKPVFIIDLWQMLITSVGTPFIGPCDVFINFLNQRPDGRYVRYPINITHIRTVDIQRVSNPSFGGVAAYEEPIPASQGGIISGMNANVNRINVEDMLRRGKLPSGS